MASFEEHCQECYEKLGNRYEDVHIFLDQFSAKYGFGHRRIFHHTYGIEIVRYLYGDGAAEAARLHIKRDCSDEVPAPEDWLNADYWLNT